MKMTPISFLTSFFYSVVQITAGILLHPYQTVQSLAREKVFSWMVVLPTVVFVGAKILYLGLIVPSVRYFFSCRTQPFWGCDLIPFFANWLLFFCLYWQILLLYLFVRFWTAFHS